MCSQSDNSPGLEGSSIATILIRGRKNRLRLRVAPIAGKTPNAFFLGLLIDGIPLGDAIADVFNQLRR